MTNDELKALRESKGQSKSDLAKLLGITPMLLGRYEGGKIQIPDEVAEKVKEILAAAQEQKTASEIEVKKTARKTARKVKEKAEQAAAAVEEQAVASGIEVKKTARKTARKAKETVEQAVQQTVDAIKSSVAPNIIIQSPMGGFITVEDIVKKVPKDTADVYVRVDENKLYYVLDNGETGDVDIW